MIKDLNISLIQSQIFWKNIDKNLSHFSNLISAIKETDIILLPEMFNTAFCPMSNHLAETMDGKTINWMKEIANQKDTFLREKAELENFKKRLTKEKDDFVQFANERLLQELIQIEDNLERALEVPNATLESLKEGVEMIQKQFKDFLKNFS